MAFNDRGGRPQGGFGGRPQGGGRPGGFGGRSQGGFRGNDRGDRATREDFFNKARKRVQVAISSRDNLLIQSVGAVDEMNKASNLLFERLTEWYGMYFPEFRTPEPAKYVEGVLLIDRHTPHLENMEKVFGEQAKTILGRMEHSVGTKLEQGDLSQIQSLAVQIKLIWKLRDEVEAYEAKIAKEICPNVSHLAGPELAAKLVAQAGGLQRLATFPSSTIQVLGAEKALFKHLKSGSKPPKHGLLFQHPLIGKSPKKIRGKIARALAGKIAIAVKADAISHNFIAEKLKEQFEGHANRIIASAAQKTAPAAPKTI